MNTISQNVDDKCFLNPVSAEAESLIKECPGVLIDFYEAELPKWEERITETVGQTSWFTDQPNLKISSRDILYFWPLFLGFCWSFDQKFVTLNLLQLAYSMRPEAFAIDAHFRKKQGQDFSDILEDHWQGAIALWISQIILANFNRVIGKNYIGQQVARFIFAGPDSNPMNFKKLTQNDSEIESALYLEIIRKLGKSARDAVKMTRDYFVRQVLRDKLQSIPSEFIDTFSAEGQQLQDAIDGHYRFVIPAAHRTVRRAAGLKEDGFIGDRLTEDDLGEFQDIGRPRFKQTNPLVDADDMDSLEAQIRTEYYNTKVQLEGEERRARALGEARAELLLAAMVSQKTKDVMDLYFENPDLTDAEIAEKLGITRMTVSKYKDIGFNYVKKIYRITA